MPGRRRRGFRYCRFGCQLNRQGRWWGTLMRHFLLSGPVSMLAFGMGATAPMRVLIATAGSPYRLVARLQRASLRAVAVAVITIAADKHGGAAAGAQVASCGDIHWHSGPMGSRRRCALREILCRQPHRCWGCGARHRNWLGGWDRCRACVSTGQSAFYSIADAGATFTQIKRDSSFDRFSSLCHGPLAIPAALRLPDDALLRNPSAASPAGAKPQTGINMPEIQKPESHPVCACLPHTKLFAAGLVRKGDTVITCSLIDISLSIRFAEVKRGDNRTHRFDQLDHGAQFRCPP